jgi:hypothetical protein
LQAALAIEAAEVVDEVLLAVLQEVDGVVEVLLAAEALHVEAQVVQEAAQKSSSYVPHQARLPRTSHEHKSHRLRKTS